MKSTYIIIFLSLVTVSLNISCKKKDKNPNGTTVTETPCDTTFINNYINDTIFPSKYLMTYPGSEWNYDNGTSVTCDAWENVAIAVPTASGSCVTVAKSYYVLPHTSMSYPYIFYNKAINAHNPNKSWSYQLLDTAIGVYYSNSGVSGTYPNQCSFSEQYEVVEKLTSMEVLSVTFQDVIHIRRTFSQHCPHSPSMPPDNVTEYYYAKNVGLIRKVSTPYYEYNGTKNLVSYTIGPH